MNLKKGINEPQLTLISNTFVHFYQTLSSPLFWKLNIIYFIVPSLFISLFDFHSFRCSNIIKTCGVCKWCKLELLVIMGVHVSRHWWRCVLTTHDYMCTLCIWLCGASIVKICIIKAYFFLFCCNGVHNFLFICLFYYIFIGFISFDAGTTWFPTFLNCSHNIMVPK
jgi:hypothetical protein